MKHEGLTPEKYYDSYQGWDLELLAGRVKELIPASAIPPEFAALENVKWVLLGSATSKNISKFNRISAHFRPSKTHDDTVTLLDVNYYPLQDHQEDYNSLHLRDTLPGAKFPTHRWDFVQGDLLHMPFGAEQFEGLVSDYTLNYLSTEQQLFEAFAEMARVLNSGPNTALVTVQCSNNLKRREDHLLAGDSLATGIVQGGVEITTFPLYLYYEAIAGAGLQIVAQSQIQLDLLLILQKL